MQIHVYDRSNGRLVARMAIERVARRIAQGRLGENSTPEQLTKLEQAVERELKGGLHLTTPGCLYCRDELEMEVDKDTEGFYR